MKNRWIIVVGVLVVLLVVGFFAYVLFLQPKSATVSTPVSLTTNQFPEAVTTAPTKLTTTPDTFSINFYKWYIGNKEADINFPSATQLTTTFAQWTTASFILQ
jgi:flagellar basal body-associated protein FliL